MPLRSDVVFLSEPPSTQYDLRFNLAGFPIRVHPWFWLAVLILGAGGSVGQQGFDREAGIQLLIWVGVVFVSILIHEMGHGLAFRWFGTPARIVLYMFGGLAIPDRFKSAWSRPARLDADAHMLVSVAGPLAGFAFAGLIVALIFAAGGSFQVELTSLPGWHFELPEGADWPLYSLVHYLLWINIFWGLINLLPIYPLDGGQIAYAWFTKWDPAGTVKALQLSFLTAVLVAIAGYLLLQSLFMALFFGSLAYSNYMAMRYSGGGFGGGSW